MDRDAEIEEKMLARLREKYRGRFPTERLILFIDRRQGSAHISHVVIVSPASPWHDLFPPEQISEVVDRVRPD